MPVHELLLDSSDRGVRIAAAQNIGVIFETLRICNGKVIWVQIMKIAVLISYCKQPIDGNEEEDNTTANIPEYDNMDGLVHTLSELSLETNNVSDYEDDEDPVFQNVLETLEEGVQPVREISINGNLVQLKGWGK